VKKAAPIYANSIPKGMAGVRDPGPLPAPATFTAGPDGFPIYGTRWFRFRIPGKARNLHSIYLKCYGIIASMIIDGVA